MTPESSENRIKRLAMRSMRRGIKEMDLILSAFAGRALGGMDAANLALYDQLLEENDHDLYAWINGQVAAPGQYTGLIGQIAAMAQGVTRPG
jgi:antitoxin CptB